MAKIRKINVSEIVGRSPFDQDDDAIMPSGTVVVYEKNNNGVIEYVLRVHDGVTNGGVAISPGPGPVIFNGSDGIVPSNLNDGIAALFNNGDVYITGGESLGFTGIGQFDGNSTRMLRFWNGEGRHSTDNDTTELVELRVGNDAAEGDPTEGFFVIRTEKQDEPENEKMWKFDANGVLTLPAGGIIAETEITGNPTVVIAPANPDVESQVLFIKGGAAYSVDENGIFLTWNEINPRVTDTVNIFVGANTYASQTLYWWINPAEAGIANPGFGIVEIDEFGNGVFTFTVDSDDYEFTVRVSPTNNVYDPASIGVETLVFNSSAPSLGDYHLHLTTGDLSETSVILGTDDHNVRTTTDGGVEINTFLYPEGGGSAKWTFDNNGDLTFPGSSNAKIGESEPGLVVFSDFGFAVVTNAGSVNTYEVEFIGYVSNGFGDDSGATLTVTEIISGTITDGMIIYGAGLPPEGWAVTFGGGVPNAGSGGIGNYLLDGANILTSSQSFNNGVNAAGSNAWVFESNGDLRLSDSGQIIGDDVIVKGSSSVTVKVTNPLNPLATRDWAFGGNGHLVFPNGTSQTTAYVPEDNLVKISGEWLVNPGTNTYSFTVPSDGTYIMWVKGNIPNGIITWNATASVSNSNVPAIGTQYAWNYTGGGSPIALTSIPDQIVGVAGTISTDNTYVGSTSNRFDFGISNTSGSTQTIYYGYTKIS